MAQTVGGSMKQDTPGQQEEEAIRLTLSHLAALSPYDIGLTIDWILPLFSPPCQWDHSPQFGNVTSQLKLCSSQSPGQKCESKLEQ